MIPDKIYLGIGPMENGHGRVIYSEWVEEPYPGAERNVEFIRKNALLEWAKEKIAHIDAVLKIGYDQMALAQRVMLVSVIDKLQSL